MSEQSWETWKCVCGNEARGIPAGTIEVTCGQCGRHDMRKTGATLARVPATPAPDPNAPEVGMVVELDSGSGPRERLTIEWIRNGECKLSAYPQPDRLAWVHDQLRADPTRIISRPDAGKGEVARPRVGDESHPPTLETEFAWVPRRGTYRVVGIVDGVVIAHGMSGAEVPMLRFTFAVWRGEIAKDQLRVTMAPIPSFRDVEIRQAMARGDAPNFQGTVSVPWQPSTRVGGLDTATANLNAPRHAYDESDASFRERVKAAMGDVTNLPHVTVTPRTFAVPVVTVTDPESDRARANRLADECGVLSGKLQAAEAMCHRLTLDNERLTRKARR